MPDAQADRDAARAASADRARRPLLDVITQESLDEDYQHVAEQKRSAAAAGTAPTRRPRFVATAVVAAFGLLVTVAALQTSNASGVTSASREELQRQIKERGDEVGTLQEELVRQRARNIRLQDQLDTVSGAERTASKRVTRMGAVAGYTPVSGPGVVITVDDAPSGEAVRDEDLALLVNGLWEAGAEAISINGKRLTARSALRNAGAAINLNGPPPLSPPYVVSAIGDNGSLEADLLNTTTGLRFVNVADALGFPVTTKKVDNLDLPAATLRKPRSATVEGAQPPPAKKERPS